MGYTARRFSRRRVATHSAQKEPMIRPRRIGHATFETPDLEKAIAYYAETMGLVLAAREKDRAYLASKIGPLTIALLKGAEERCSKLAFEVAPGADFGDLSRELARDGVKSELRNDSLPGIGQVLSFADCKGTTIELFKEWSYLCKHAQVSGIGPLKLGHVAFVVQDVNATVEFYERLLGFRVSDWIGDFFVFMRCNSDHHSVNFIKGENIKLHHMAFELKDFIHIQNSCDLFGQKNISIIWGPLRQGPGHNIATYHRNHDDQVIELYTELDQMKDEELGYFDPRPWHRDQPQRPKIWEPGKTNTWGTPPAPDFHRNRL
jgi:catechol 2,3-dioxygenase-like lactoylglutathione lyase family enzyme